MTPKIEIPKDRIADFCRRWKISQLSLFGSILRDDFQPDSDVDVLVTFAAGATWSAWDVVDMVDELRVMFGHEVDLVEKPAIRNPFRRHEILRTAQVLYAV